MNKTTINVEVPQWAASCMVQFLQLVHAAVEAPTKQGPTLVALQFAVLWPNEKAAHTGCSVAFSSDGEPGVTAAEAALLAGTHTAIAASTLGAILGQAAEQGMKADQMAAVVDLFKFKAEAGAKIGVYQLNDTTGIDAHAARIRQGPGGGL